MTEQEKKQTNSSADAEPEKKLTDEQLQEVVGGVERDFKHLTKEDLVKIGMDDAEHGELKLAMRFAIRR